MAEYEERKEVETESKSEIEAVREEKVILKPWEQHAGVISIPRFDYNAPSALLHRSYSGFLITCSIKREKSATKEAMSILEKYVRSNNNGSSESSDVNRNTKRRKTFTDENGGECAKGMKSKNEVEDTGGLSENDCSTLATTDTTRESGFDLSLVKLTKSGLLLLTFVRENAPETVDVLSKIFQCLESGSLKSPLWCHRIFPIQATCRLNQKELRAVVSKLVLQFMINKQDKLARPVQFAVGYNRRGIEEIQLKIAKDTFQDCDLLSLLDRNKCFEVVASAVKDAVSDSAVNLISPELSILVELLPLSGVPNGSLVAAVSVLPQNLVNVKPRLCIKPLVSDAKDGKNRKGGSHCENIQLSNSRGFCK